MTQHQNFEKNIIVIYQPFFYWNFTNFLIKILKVKWFFSIAINETKKIKIIKFWYVDFNVQPKPRTMIKIFIFQLFLHFPKFLRMITTLATNKNSFEKHCYQPTKMGNSFYIFNWNKNQTMEYVKYLNSTKL